MNSNQIVLSFGVLIAFLSPKQSEKGELCGILGKDWKSFAMSKSGMQGEEERESTMKHILDDSRVSHFWSTF